MTESTGGDRDDRDLDYAVVFDVLPVAVALLSPDLAYLAVNRAYERVSGRTGRELVGQEVFEAFPGGPGGSGAAQLRASLERVLAHGERDVMALRYDVEEPGPGGPARERYWSIVNVPVPAPGPDGRVPLIVHRVEEVTEFIRQVRDSGAPGGGPATTQMEVVEAELFERARELQAVNQRLASARTRERRTSEALRQAMRKQQRAVADTSHDLRGPLTGLRTRLQAALADPDADAEEILHAALLDAERLSDIVADLLELASLEAGAPAPAKPVDLARLVEEEIARRADVVPVTVVLQPDVVVDGAPVRLARLVGNLLDNAERHAAGHVEVSLAAHGTDAVLEVIDDGPGIPTEDREAIFSRFYRRPDARESDPHGTGLGLPIARQITETYGGGLRSADPPHPPGARMIVRLPLHQLADPPPDG